MFRTLARLIADPTFLAANAVPDRSTLDTLFSVHPLQLSRWLEQVWALGGTPWPGMTAPAPLGGGPNVVPRLALPLGLRDVSLQSGINTGGVAIPPAPAIVLHRFIRNATAPTLGLNLPTSLPFEHLLYSYLVESTGVVSILGEIARRYVNGESLPPPSVDTMVWVRATEDLFFRDPPLFHIGGLSSRLRPDAEINRRNAYWRMFGFDLPHPVPGLTEGQPWKRDTGSSVNTGFLEIWNELLRQVWLGIENDRNQVGANPTDANYVGYLCQTLREMLQARRLGGMIAPAEFSYGALCSWCHLTVEFDNALVGGLGASGAAGANPADRLAVLGSRVGITPPRQARELFELAQLVSPILWSIELGLYDDATSAEMLYRSFNAPTRQIPALMFRIIDLWQSATGHRVKDAAAVDRTAAAARLKASVAQPVRLPSVTPPVNGVTPGM